MVERGPIEVDHLGSPLVFCLVFDEAADGLASAPDVGDIMAIRFGPEMSGERAFTWGSRLLLREHCCSFRQGIPKDSLDVVG